MLYWYNIFNVIHERTCTIIGFSLARYKRPSKSKGVSTRFDLKLPRWLTPLADHQVLSILLCGHQTVKSCDVLSFFFPRANCQQIKTSKSIITYNSSVIRLSERRWFRLESRKQSLHGWWMISTWSQLAITIVTGFYWGARPGAWYHCPFWSTTSPRNMTSFRVNMLEKQEAR